MADLQPGDVVAGKYRVERVLGEGGMGVVVAAKHLTLNETVALKFMRPSAVLRADSVPRFLREARAAGGLKSAHVARVLDVDQLEDGSLYIVMEYLEGHDLAHVLKNEGPLDVATAADYVLQACDALAEAHARGIVHRDLKPGNLFVTKGPDGLPLLKVLDFGVSKGGIAAHRNMEMTKSTSLLGSPLYMSPEQMKSARNVDARTDIWSLGVVLYELVGGRVPFQGETLGGVMDKVLSAEPPPLRSLRGDVPDAYADVVTRCLEKDPARRFLSVAELARALAPLAPVAARPLADRVSDVLRASAPVADKSVSPLAASAVVATPGPVAGLPMPAPVASPTPAGWGATAPLAPARAPVRPWAWAAAVAGLAGLAALGLWLARPAPKEGAAAGETTATDPSMQSPPLASSAPVVTPSAVTPSTTSETASEPPAESASARTSSSPTVKSGARAAPKPPPPKPSAAPAPSPPAAPPPAPDPFGTSRN